MRDKLYRITFDNYLKKSLNQDKPSSYNNYLNTTAGDKLNQHIQNVPARYSDFIKFIYPYLCNTQLFLTLSDYRIMTQNKAIIFSNASEFFNYFNTFSGVLGFFIDFTDSYFQKLYKLYYSYLIQNYLSQIYMNLHANFYMINKEIIFIDPNYTDIGTGDDTIRMLQRYGVSDSNLKPLLKAIPKILDNSSFHTSAPCCCSNYSFNFSFRKNIFHAYFTDEGIKYEKCSNEYMNTHVISTVDPVHFTEESFIQSWIDILYAITGGIKENIDNLSMLCALIMTNYYKNINYALPSKNCSPLSLYIIYAPEEQAATLRYWLKSLVPYDYEESDYQLKDITKTNNIFNLIRQNYRFPTYIPVEPSKSKESELQIETIKKLIKRKEINIKDNHGINHTLINHLPIICFVNNQQQLSYLQANFKTKTFSFEPYTVPINAEYNLERAQLLIDFLSIYGLKMLFDTNFKRNVRPNEPIVAESITQRFINDCLKPEPNHTFYADDLYDVYSYYYHLFYTDSPLSKICFNKELRKMLPYEYEYKKPRHSRSDNRYAFIGINIDENNAKKAAEYAYNIRKDISKKSVSDYLINVQNSVNEILQTLHNNLSK